MTVRIEQHTTFVVDDLLPRPVDAPSNPPQSIHRVIEITDDQAKGEKGRAALLKSAMTAMKTMSKVEDGGPVTTTVELGVAKTTAVKPAGTTPATISPAGAIKKPNTRTYRHQPCQKSSNEP